MTNGNSRPVKMEMLVPAPPPPSGGGGGERYQSQKNTRLTASVLFALPCVRYVVVA